MEPTKLLDEREKDIQALCDAVLSMGVEQTGDHGSGGQCPLCFKDCSWKASLFEIEHDSDCAFLIAKDLKTGFKN